MPFLICRICNADLYVKPSHVKLGWGKYCSVTCRVKAQFKGKIVNCYICEKKIYRSPNKLARSSSKKFFCTKTCQTIWRNTEMYTQEKHPNWQGGESSYRRLMDSSERRKVCTLCKTNDYRVPIVHHVDKNRKNNNISNLTWLCHNCHYLVHHFEEKRTELMKYIV